MDELAALELVAGSVRDAGDDAAVVGDVVLTTDMLHERSDFPPGTTRYTAGWRSVGASLSDVAAMGAGDPAALAVYAAPTFDPEDLQAFLDGATAVTEAVDGRYVGGDLDTHVEFTVATMAMGHLRSEGAPVRRSGATSGEVICVTGSLGRSAAAVRCFDDGDVDLANELFRFAPRIAAGEALAPYASAMMDSSDGLARSLHQLADASESGVEVRREAIPIHPALADRETDPFEAAITFGEDFELVLTVPEDALAEARGAASVDLTRIGRVTDDRTVCLDGSPLPNVGYTHGT